jgi:hypothetical protein
MKTLNALALVALLSAPQLATAARTDGLEASVTEESEPSPPEAASESKTSKPVQVAEGNESGGGGAGKGIGALGLENIAAIVKDKKVTEYIHFKREIQEIKRVPAKGSDKFAYQVLLNGMDGNDCSLEVVVDNGHSYTIDKIRVKSVKVLSGCKDPVKKEERSLHEEHKAYFDLMDKLTPVDYERPYKEYLELAKKYPAGKRKAIIETMKEIKKPYYEALSKNADKMRAALKKNPDALTGGVIMVLAEKVLKVHPSSMPPLIALDLLPLFVLEDE